MNNMSIFDYMYPKYKITKPIRLIELFSGYGSQALALKYLGVNFEHWKTCEWAVKSIQAYKYIHFTDDNNDYSKEWKDEHLISWLFEKGISSNYNEPMKKEQIIKLGEEKRRNIFNNIYATHNLVNIQQVKGKDLDIKDTDKYEYIMTYSFPCQDLSLAGKGKGMSDTSTRSGMLWEVERILSECEELPQMLLMENVPQVHSLENMKDFHKWQVRLEELGYKNYWQDLIATDYGIPQTRNRCFMISILGNYSYSFPKPIPLKLKLKDLLEDDVDEKYYISEDLMEHIIKTKVEHNEYTQYDRYKGDFEQLCRVWKEKSPTLHTNSNEIKIYVKNATKKGYIEATDGDRIDISSRMEHHRGTVQKQMIQTLDTQGGESKGVVSSDLRIRKLTPKECFRLMGVKDEDYEKCAKNQSNASLYHLAGDSLVTLVFCAIMSTMIDNCKSFEQVLEEFYLQISN